MMTEVDQGLTGQSGRFEKFFRDESVGATAAQLTDELEEFCQALPPGSSIDLRGANGFSFHFVSGPSLKAQDLRSLHHQFVFSGETFDLEARTSVAGAVHTLDLLRVLLWSLLPVVIAIACVGGAWLSGRALKPVQNISNAALMISIENLSERLPVPATGDELAHLTEVLNSMFSRLESAVKTLSQFVADASHELRTPLTVIRTTADLALRRDRTPESYRQSLDEVSVEAERMTRLIEDLLLLARNDAAVVEMPLAALDLRDVLHAVCSEAHSLAELRNIRLNASIGSEPAIVSGNQPALHRLFLVLVDNALKYSPEGGEVILKVNRNDSHVDVSVKDFGAGIPNSDLPHIFKRFYRADHARSGGGHGLGLSLASSIAQAHGASIEVESSENSGSVFRVVFTDRDQKPAYASRL